MTDQPEVRLSYPSDENDKLHQLEVLFEDWKTLFSKNNHVQNYSAEDMVTDGFYPYYFSQKVKILYIGREARGISGCNYIDILFNAYKEKRVGGQHINSVFFHKRMLYITFGIMHDFPKWGDIPYADQIVETFGTAEGISFAFMNISKFSNEKVEFQSDWNLINDSILNSSNESRNLIREEIEILEPDLIITMNFDGLLKNLGEMRFEKYSDRYNTYVMNLKGKNALVINSSHFTAMGLNDETDFYEPIKDAYCRFKK